MLDVQTAIFDFLYGNVLYYRSGQASLSNSFRYRTIFMMECNIKHPGSTNHVTDYGSIAALNGLWHMKCFINCLNSLLSTMPLRKWFLNTEYSDGWLLMYRRILSLKWWLWWRFVCLNCWMFEESAFCMNECKASGTGWKTIHSNLPFSYHKKEIKIYRSSQCGNGKTETKMNSKFMNKIDSIVCSLVIAHRLCHYFCFLHRVLLYTSIFG